MADHDYDLFVIGGGSGGVRAARISAAHGAKVAMAEEYRKSGGQFELVVAPGARCPVFQVAVTERG